MNAGEITALLAYLVSADGRITSDLTVSAWQDILGDVPVDVARRAVVEHYRTANERLMPVHIIRFWQAEREAEAAEHQTWTPPPRGRANPAHIAECMREMRATILAAKHAREQQERDQRAVRPAEPKP